MASHLILAGLGAAMLAASAAQADSGVFGAQEGRARILAVVAAQGADPRLIEQRRLFAAMKAGAEERDLVLVEGIGTDARARALRQRLGAPDGSFRVVLIGKDGGEKLSSSEPLGAAQLFPLIDAMPMRRSEMRRGG